MFVYFFREPFYFPSLTSNGADRSDSLDEDRISTSAYLNRHQTYLVQCLEQRFAQFQGRIHLQRMELFQIGKYIHH